VERSLAFVSPLVGIGQGEVAQMLEEVGESGAAMAIEGRHDFVRTRFKVCFDLLALARAPVRLCAGG